MRLTDDAIESLASTAETVRANAEKFAWPVPSPCVSTCLMDEETGCCQGCLRSLDEIRLWGNADQDDKRETWARIAQRLTEYQR